MSAVPALTLQEVNDRALEPALRLLPPRMDTPEARVQLLATGLQESQFRNRRQMVAVKDANGQFVLRPLGPAKSFWQGERGGGMVHGVRTNPATRDLAAALYEARQVRATDTAIWNAIENDDVLAAGLARLLLWADPQRLPVLGEVQRAWDTYVRVWGPGKPRRDTWNGYYARALAFVRGQDE